MAKVPHDYEDCSQNMSKHSKCHKKSQNPVGHFEWRQMLMKQLKRYEKIMIIIAGGDYIQEILFPKLYMPPDCIEQGNIHIVIICMWT